SDRAVFCAALVGGPLRASHHRGADGATAAGAPAPAVDSALHARALAASAPERRECRRAHSYARDPPGWAGDSAYRRPPAARPALSAAGWHWGDRTFDRLWRGPPPDWRRTRGLGGGRGCSR